MYILCSKDVTPYYESVTWKTDITIFHSITVYPVINLPLLQHFSCSEIMNISLINQYEIGTPKT